MSKATNKAKGGLLMSGPFTVQSIANASLPTTSGQVQPGMLAYDSTNNKIVFYSATGGWVTITSP